MEGMGSEPEEPDDMSRVSQDPCNDPSALPNYRQPQTRLTVTAVSTNSIRIQRRLSERSATYPQVGHHVEGQDVYETEYEKGCLEEWVEFFRGENMSHDAPFHWGSNRSRRAGLTLRRNQPQSSTSNRPSLSDNHKRQKVCTNEYHRTVEVAQTSKGDLGGLAASVRGPRKHISNRSHRQVQQSNTHDIRKKGKITMKEKLLAFLHKLDPRQFPKRILKQRPTIQRRQPRDGNPEILYPDPWPEDVTQRHMGQPRLAETDSRHLDLVVPNIGLSDASTLGTTEVPEVAPETTVPNAVVNVREDSNGGPCHVLDPSAESEQVFCQCTSSCSCRRNRSEDPSIRTSLRAFSRSSSEGGVRETGENASQQNSRGLPARRPPREQSEPSLLASSSSLLTRHMGGLGMVQQSPHDSAYSNDGSQSVISSELRAQLVNARRGQTSTQSRSFEIFADNPRFSSPERQDTGQAEPLESFSELTTSLHSLPDATEDGDVRRISNHTQGSIIAAQELTHNAANIPNVSEDERTPTQESP